MTGLRTETGKPDKLSCRAEDRPPPPLFARSVGCCNVENAPSHRLSKGKPLQCKSLWHRNSDT